MWCSFPGAILHILQKIEDTVSPCFPYESCGPMYRSQESLLHRIILGALVLSVIEPLLLHQLSKPICRPGQARHVRCSDYRVSNPPYLYVHRSPISISLEVRLCFNNTVYGARLSSIPCCSTLREVLVVRLAWFPPQCRGTGTQVFCLA